MTREIKLEFAWEPILAAMNEGAVDGMTFAGNLIASESKGRAPYKTGALRTSIQSRAPTGSLWDNNLEVVIGAGMPYAVYQEFGTGIYGPRHRQFQHASGSMVDGMQANPFFQPTIEAEAETINTQLAAAIDLSLDNYGRKFF